MLPETGLDAQAVGEWIRNAKAALDIFKGARGLVPQGPKRDELELTLKSAEEALTRSDAALAKKLGYQLCQCEFPPNIMLWREGEGAFICPNEDCGRQLRPARSAPAPRAAPVPIARVCPLCEGEMKVTKESPHAHFAFAGMKTHSLKCEQCGNETERDFRPGEGYR